MSFIKFVILFVMKRGHIYIPTIWLCDFTLYQFYLYTPYRKMKL